MVEAKVAASMMAPVRLVYVSAWFARHVGGGLDDEELAAIQGKWGQELLPYALRILVDAVVMGASVMPKDAESVLVALVGNKQITNKQSLRVPALATSYL